MDGCGMGGSCRFSGSSCTAGAAGKVPMSKGSIQGQELGGSHAADVHSEGAFSLRRVAMTRARICRCCPLFLLQLCPAEAATGVLTSRTLLLCRLWQPFPTEWFGWFLIETIHVQETLHQAVRVCEFPTLPPQPGVGSSPEKFLVRKNAKKEARFGNSHR